MSLATLKMILPDFNQISGSEKSQYPIALSMCFYKSDRFDKTKHVDPLFKQNKTEADFLIFTDDESIVDLLPERCKVYLTNQPLEGWHKHFYRYAGAKFSNKYDWVWFTGTDNPWLAHRLKLMNLAKERFIRIITQCSNATNITANCALRGSELRNLYLTLKKGISDVRYPNAEWHCDDKFLRDYLKKVDEPVLHINHSEFAGWSINEDHVLWIMNNRPGSVIVNP